MEKEGTITKSTGPLCSPIVLVRKKDGTICFCVDYCKLNDVTHKDAYALPRIDDILEALLGAKYFCSIDLASVYWQIKVADKDREKTAFISHLGLYEFLCIPFGLTGAPATFLSLMDKVLDGLIGERYLVYLDDVIIYGGMFEETLSYLKLVNINVIHFVTVKFSYYLLNQEFTFCTDHSLLRWLDSFQDKATDVLA